MPAKFKVVGALIVATLLAVATLARAEQLRDSKFGFTLEIPAGFDEYPAAVRADPDVLYAFRRDDSQKAVMAVAIQRMHGVLGRKPLDPKMLPADKKAKILTMRWQDFELQAIEIHERAGSVDMVAYTVQVPLKPEAIQIAVASPEEQSREAFELVKNLLRSLDGRSNWLHSLAPPLANSPSYRYLLIGLAGLLLIAGVIFLLRVRRKTRRGTLLGFSFVVVAMSFTLAPIDVLEMGIALPTIRILGVIGILIGLFNILRRRPVTPPPELPSAPADQGGR